jgi:hypothetical protein
MSKDATLRKNGIVRHVRLKTVDAQENPNIFEEIIKAHQDYYIYAINKTSEGKRRRWYFKPSSKKVFASASGKNGRPPVDSATSIVVYDEHDSLNAIRRYTHSTTQYLLIEELGLAFVPKSINEMSK